MNNQINAYAQWRSVPAKNIIKLLLLGFSSGLPIFLIFSTLSVWLGEAGVEKSAVTYFSWAALGYSFKFVWAPIVDKLPLPLLSKAIGRRRSWLLLSQFAVIGAILWMSSVDPMHGLTAMAFGAVALGFASATQDIVIDAYRIETADVEQQALLSSCYIAGYRIGTTLAVAGAFYLAFYLGSTKESYSYLAWQITYAIMASAMLIGVFTTLFISEPKEGDSKVYAYSSSQYVRFFFLFIVCVAVLIQVFIHFPSLEKVLIYFFDVEISQDESIKRVIEFAWSSLKMVSALLAALGVALLFVFKTERVLYLSWCAYIVRFLVLVFLFHHVLAIVLTFLINIGINYDKSINELSKSFSIGLKIFSILFAMIGVSFLSGVKKAMVTESYISPIKDFFMRYGKLTLWVLLLIGFYRVSDIVMGAIANVFYQDLGYTKLEMANITKVFGLIMTILGSFIGGFLSLRFGVMRILLVGAVLAAVTNLLFAWLATAEPTKQALMLVIAADNLSAGLAVAAFVAWLSSLTSVSFTATQYAIFSSVMTLFPKLLGGYSGTMVESMGYDSFFTLTACIGVPVIALIIFLNKKITI